MLWWEQRCRAVQSARGQQQYWQLIMIASQCVQSWDAPAAPRVPISTALRPPTDQALSSSQRSKPLPPPSWDAQPGPEAFTAPAFPFLPGFVSSLIVFVQVVERHTVPLPAWPLRARVS